MDLNQFLSIRSAFNRIPQQDFRGERISFDELALLCKLQSVNVPVRTSALSEYSNALRPTTTHRLTRLDNFDMIKRVEGATDARSIECSITDHGVATINYLSRQIVKNIPKGKPLHSIKASRVPHYLCVMGTQYMTAGDFIIFSLFVHENEQRLAAEAEEANAQAAELEGEGQEMEAGTPEPESTTMTISQIVEMTGFAQPTVSMTVSALDDKGLVSRSRTGKGMPHPRTVSVSLSEAGEARGEELKRIVRAMSMNTK